MMSKFAAAVTALAALTCAVAPPAGAHAARVRAHAAQPRAHAAQPRAHAAQPRTRPDEPLAIAARAVATSSVRTATGPVRTTTGVVTATGWSLTIQTGGRLMGRINAMAATADAITRQDYPYVYGGGHAEAGVASTGIKGPGYTGHTRGYDCSGSVAAVLAGAGLWAPGSGVPDDAGVVQQLLQDHDLARGPGRGPDEVTLYDHPGVHIFMNVDGRFFGTSDGAGGGSRKGGAGWLNDGAPDASSRVYKQYHVLPSVLRDRTSYGHSFTFIATSSATTTGVQLGDKVRVSYQVTGSGTMVLRGLAYIGAATSTGTVTSLAPDGSSFAIQTPSGAIRTFSTGTDTYLLDGLETGDQVQVLYTRRAGILTARAVTVTAQPTATPTPPPSPSGD
jgi:hypothetical protein